MKAWDDTEPAAALDDVGGRFPRFFDGCGVGASHVAVCLVRHAWYCRGNGLLVCGLYLLATAPVAGAAGDFTAGNHCTTCLPAIYYQRQHHSTDAPGGMTF